MNRTIIVSDLHVDTWTDREIGTTGKSKKEHFFDLLDWCERAQVNEFVINGDLMDLPPYDPRLTFAPGPSIARDVVDRLVEFASKVPLTYIYGNHDIGISGYRSPGDYGISVLRPANFAYPDYVIDDYPDSTILIEHGHRADPWLLLYGWNIAKRAYGPEVLESRQWGMQRRRPKIAETPPPPGVPELPPVSVTPGENAYYAARVGQAPLPKETWLTKAAAWVKAWGGRRLAQPTMEHWWREAQDALERYVEHVFNGGHYPKPVVYQIYGHTHRADPRCAPEDGFGLAGGVMGYYINAGTWTKAVDQGWYVDIDPTGKPWLQDWINEPEGLRRLQP